METVGIKLMGENLCPPCIAYFAVLFCYVSGFDLGTVGVQPPTKNNTKAIKLGL